MTKATRRFTKSFRLCPIIGCNALLFTKEDEVIEYAASEVLLFLIVY
jgi:hypothetical protein